MKIEYIQVQLYLIQQPRFGWIKIHQSEQFGDKWGQNGLDKLLCQPIAKQRTENFKINADFSDSDVYTETIIVISPSQQQSE